MKRHAGMLKHSADLYGELLAASATLLEAVADSARRALDAWLAANTGEIIDLAADHAAMRARYSVSPDDAPKELESLGFIMEVRGRKNRNGKLLR